MGPVGFPEMFAIFIIALLLFGPKKLPELGRTLGKALSEFRRAKNELKSTFESHLQELERETRMSEISSSSSTPVSHSPSYSYPYEDYNPYNAESPTYSAPAQIAEEPRPALPASDVAHEITNHEPAEEIHSAPAMSGTVARSNGMRPLGESVNQTPTEPAVSTPEEHPV